MVGPGWNKPAALLKLVLLILVFCHSQLAGASDPYATEYDETAPRMNYYVKERNDRIAKERQEFFRKRVAIPHAVSDEVFAAYAARQQGTTVPTPSSAVFPTPSPRTLVATAFILLTLVLAIRKLAPEILDSINKRFNPWAQTFGTAANYSANVRAEDEAFSEFMVAFRTGPSAITDPSGVNAFAESNGNFFANASKIFRELQKLIKEICEATTAAVRQRTLADLHRELRALKGEAGAPELLPLWQMASALEGLVKQLTDKAGNVSGSTLRTVAAGLDLLENLCVSNVPADLLSNPPFRLLAVDDDPISRNAVSFALKKALDAPDLAEAGEAALALVAEHVYDVIFLDVQMPGMDGFELCERIHDTVTNATTPVVFVTCQNDFEARAKSTLCGGSDLISKPFLTFEITVKALTLAVQSRLQSRAHSAAACRGAGVSALRAPVQVRRSSTYDSRHQVGVKATLETHSDDQTQAISDSNVNATAPSSRDTTVTTRRSLSAPAMQDTSVSSDELLPKELLQAFRNRASANLGPLRDLIQSIFQATDGNLRQEMLADFFLRFNALAPQGVVAEAHPALHLTAALEGLLTKLLANPKNCTSSTLLTVATAVDLLIELCGPGVKSDLATNPPVRLLVVDDDPVARRAISGALQMTFGKPENADGGEAALDLAAEKPFDAIFLDVEMPGMDGFTTCMRIRETEPNRATPVVFVTGHTDFKSRNQSAVSGGNDLLGKPFLPAEIKVKALTFVLRGRLHKPRNADYLALPHEEEATESELIAALT